MLRRYLFQPLQSFWTAVNVLSLTSLLFALPFQLHAQVVSSSLSQENNTSPTCSDLSEAPCPSKEASAAPLRRSVETSLSVGAFSQLTPTRVQNIYGADSIIGVQTQGIAPTAGVLGTFRQQFRPWLGYSVNMGYSRVDERYTVPYTIPIGPDYHIPSNMYELSFSYVLEKHLTPRLTGFASAGTGFVTILPTNRPAVPAAPGSDDSFPPVNFRPEGTAGFGLDLSLSRNIALRAEYHGLLYKTPDFGLNLQRSTTWTSEPTLSLVYRFGRNHKKAPATSFVRQP